MGPRILIAGIGNVFRGDEAFGVEAVRRLTGLNWPDGVRIGDYGIRGFDLCQALLDDYETCVLINAMARGAAPGALECIEIDMNMIGGPDEPTLEGPAIHPMSVLEIVKSLGGGPKRLVLVACEPASLTEEDEQLQGAIGLSAPVEAALDGAVRMVIALVDSMQPVRETVQAA